MRVAFAGVRSLGVCEFSAPRLSRQPASISQPSPFRAASTRPFPTRVRMSSTASHSQSAAVLLTQSFVSYGRRVLEAAEPSEKVRLTNAAAAAWRDSREIGQPLGIDAVPASPARPVLPKIVGSGEMPTAKTCGRPKIVFILSALAHVELNAIDLAWDTAIRFGQGMDASWFDDFLSIAVDEARHFGWLSGRLEDLGSFYGDLPAHRIVWDAADSSKTSRRERLALGQLCQEARGLDAGPKLAERLTGMGDMKSAAIVSKIAEEEVAHVSIGVRHFIDECERDPSVGREDVVPIFHEIALRLSNPGAFNPPFNTERRKEAGLDEEWYLPVAQEMQNTVMQRHATSGRRHCSPP